MPEQTFIKRKDAALEDSINSMTIKLARIGMKVEPVFSGFHSPGLVLQGFELRQCLLQGQ